MYVYPVTDDVDKSYRFISEVGSLQYDISVDQVRTLIKHVINITKFTLQSGGVSDRNITRLTTKLRDAGRRSPPWSAHSSRVPGRPQDGSDGNRQNRWLFSTDHKFYADEVTATLVEVKYCFQCLSMLNAPQQASHCLYDKYVWLTGHYIAPGMYNDPIQLVPINFPDVIQDLRNLHSGHLVPLDRGGKHEPNNTFLVLARSNQLQGNLTLNELIDLMTEIVSRHKTN